MEVLIVASTDREIKDAVASCKTNWIEQPEGVFSLGQVTVRFLVTGPGMVPMAYALGAMFQEHKPDLSINAGVAGAYPGHFGVGEVVHVTQEAVCDFGAESPDGTILEMPDIGLSTDHNLSQLINTEAAPYEFLPKATGLTVNRVSGTSSTIQARVARYGADVESMEGAAFFYACMKSRIPFLQIRAISNIVEPRNRERWDLDLAIVKLNEALGKMLSMLSAR